VTSAGVVDVKKLIQLKPTSTDPHCHGAVKYPYQVLAATTTKLTQQQQQQLLLLPLLHALPRCCEVSLPGTGGHDYQTDNNNNNNNNGFVAI